MKASHLKWCISAIWTILLSCNQINTPHELERALASAGPNAGELKKVLIHYAKNKEDSLKYKAACFLIRNLDKRTYYDGRLLDRYMDYPKLVLRDLDHGEYIMNSFQLLYGPYNEDSLKTKFDLQEVRSEQLIANIDAAFYAWDNQPWSKHYTFDMFCEYVLPYRIDLEVPTYDRLNVYKRFDSILHISPNENLTAVQACTLINNTLIKEGWILSHRTTFLPNYNAFTLLNYRIGSCREMKDLGTFVMRGAGIPVGSDFVPHWANRSQGHEWNVVFDSSGKAIPFLAAEDNPGTPHRPGTIKGKVYRNTFVLNPSSIAQIADKAEVIPGFLNDPYIKDVTDEYVPVSTIQVHLKSQEKKHQFAYLSVFNDMNWVPFAWAPVKNNQCEFEKLERGIVVLPCYNETGGVIPATSPLILQKDGTIRYLVADTIKRLQKMVCGRVYPTLPEHYFTDMAKGGKFQGANKPDFSDEEDLYMFNVRALPEWNTIVPGKSKKFRYVRFISSPVTQCKIAELAIYSSNKNAGVKLMGSINADEMKAMRAVTDKDPYTGYVSSTNGAWVGFDLGKAAAVDSIKFMPKIHVPPNHVIIPGKVYDLYYWTNDQWKHLATRRASTQTLEFENMPTNALFLLDSDSEIKEKRVFTYENGKQTWW